MVVQVENDVTKRTIRVHNSFGENSQSSEEPIYCNEDTGVEVSFQEEYTEKFAHHDDDVSKSGSIECDDSLSALQAERKTMVTTGDVGSRPALISLKIEPPIQGSLIQDNISINYSMKHIKCRASEVKKVDFASEMAALNSKRYVCPVEAVECKVNSFDYGQLENDSMFSGEDPNRYASILSKRVLRSSPQRTRRDDVFLGLNRYEPLPSKCVEHPSTSLEKENILPLEKKGKQKEDKTHSNSPKDIKKRYSFKTNRCIAATCCMQLSGPTSDVSLSSSSTDSGIFDNESERMHLVKEASPKKTIKKLESSCAVVSSLQSGDAIGATEESSERHRKQEFVRNLKQRHIKWNYQSEQSEILPDSLNQMSQLRKQFGFSFYHDNNKGKKAKHLYKECTRFRTATLNVGRKIFCEFLTTNPNSIAQERLSWETRDVRKGFLHDHRCASYEKSFGDLNKVWGNDRIKEAVLLANPVPMLTLLDLPEDKFALWQFGNYVEKVRNSEYKLLSNEVSEAEAGIEIIKWNENGELPTIESFFRALVGSSNPTKVLTEELDIDNMSQSLGTATSGSSWSTRDHSTWDDDEHRTSKCGSSISSIISFESGPADSLPIEVVAKSTERYLTLDVSSTDTFTSSGQLTSCSGSSLSSSDDSGSETLSESATSSLDLMSSDVSSSEDNEESSWEYEDPPECGVFINVKPNIGAKVSRIHYDYSSSIVRNEWRNQHFPEGTFPY